MNQHPHPSSVPDWLKLCRPDSAIGIKEVAKVYGITSASVLNRISKGTLPEPDFDNGASAGYGGFNKIKSFKNRKWTVKTIVQHIKTGGVQ